MGVQRVDEGEVFLWFEVMTLSERIELLVRHRATLEPWVGEYDEEKLRDWLDAEIGDWRRLERWVRGSRVVGRSPVLHVVSGNTEHAAFQSVFRATLMGCESWVKVPSEGLRNFEEWAKGFAFLRVERELPIEWKGAEVAVVYGTEETLQFFRGWISPKTRMIAHGPKLSAAFVFEVREGLFTDLADDIMRFGQRGCLSVQMVFVEGDVGKFSEKLAAALEARGRTDSISLSEAGAVRNERELFRFRIANGENFRMWESEGAVDWTVLVGGSSELRVGPGCGFVRVVQMPGVISEETLGPEVGWLTTAVVEPISSAAKLDGIAPPRICEAGKAQEPGIFWHPDGEMPLAGLVRWRDLG